MLPLEYPQCWIVKNTVSSLVLVQGDLDSSDLVVSACLCVSPVLLPGSGQAMVLYVDMQCSQIGVNVLEPCFAIIIIRKWRICECVANWSQRCLSVGNKHTYSRLVSLFYPFHSCVGQIQTLLRGHGKRHMRKTLFKVCCQDTTSHMAQSVTAWLHLPGHHIMT